MAPASLIAATVLIGGCKPFEEPHLTLHALCESGDGSPERIQAFLDLGVDVNATREMDLVALELTKDQDRDGEPDDLRGAMTPLQLAATNCDLEAIEFLIKARGDSSLGAYGELPPLQLAAGGNDDARVTALFIRAKADVNAKTEGGFTPVDWADANGKTKNAEVLRAAGGKPGKDLP